MSTRSSKSWALISTGIVVAAVLVLLAMGRTPFCKCGDISFWAGNINSDQNSQQLTDPYTLTHVIHGTLIYGLLWAALGARVSAPARLVAALAIESGWEILENTDFVINRYRAATISLNYYGDSVLNSLGDIMAMMLGFWLARRLPVRITVIGSVLLDLILLFVIRDSLALNIIMLIDPIDAIRQWQLR